MTAILTGSNEGPNRKYMKSGYLDKNDEIVYNVFCNVFICIKHSNVHKYCFLRGKTGVKAILTESLRSNSL